MSEKPRAVVIGGGVSGMTAALILAIRGHKVSLIERSPMLGLTVRGFFRNGVYFDTGLHYTGELGDAGLFRRYLSFLGLEPLPVISFDSEGFDTIRFGGGGREVRLPAGYGPMHDHLLRIFPGEEKVIGDYFFEARKVFQNAPLLSAGADVKKLFEDEARYETLENFLRQRTKNETLAAVLAIHTLLHGSAPDEVSFSQHARVAASYFDSVHTFAGGGYALVKAFERRLEEAGVCVALGRRVKSIDFSSADASGVIAGVTLDDGTVFPADTIVYTAHPRYLPDLVPPGRFKPAFTRRVRSLEDTPSAYMLFGVSDKPLFPGGARNFFLCPDTNLSASFKDKEGIGRGPYYVTASPPTKKGFGVAALALGDFSEFSPWENTLSGKRGPGYDAFKAAQLERFKKGLLAACPELAGVTFVEGATPLTFRDFTNSPSGALYGCKHTLAQYNPHPVTRIPNLWLAGQSVVAPGVLGAVISAFLACGFIVGQEQLYEELCACGKNA